MKRLALLCLLLSSLITAAAEPLRFVTWNLEWFPGLRPTASAEEADKHMKQSQEVLKKLNPDIFVAEEIRDWAVFHELVSAVPGLTVHVVSSFRDTESGRIRNQQIGIASKLKCRGAWWENWAANYPNISRGFSFAALEQPDGGLLMTYGIHLKSNAGGNSEAGAANNTAMRNEQTKQLLSHKQTIETAFTGQKIAGWIAAGDFNTNHDGHFSDQVIEMMTKGGYYNTWAKVPREKRLTWRNAPDSPYEPTTFDYIFTQGIKQTEAFILDAPREVSDHFPVGIRVMAP
jgi:endonuclease/exonuclease/phosphatase family metal-dependent hydrolase